MARLPPAQVQSRLAELRGWRLRGWHDYQDVRFRIYRVGIVVLDVEGLEL